MRDASSPGPVSRICSKGGAAVRREMEKETKKQQGTAVGRGASAAVAVQQGTAVGRGASAAAAVTKAPEKETK